MTENLANVYRGRIGLANATHNPKSAFHYAGLHLEVERKRHKKIGHSTSMLAVAYNDLAVAYSMNALYVDAIPLLIKSKQIRESLPGFRKDWLFSPHYHLALTFYYQGKDQDAVELLESTIKDREELLLPNDRVSVR